MQHLLVTNSTISRTLKRLVFPVSDADASRDSSVLAMNTQSHDLFKNTTASALTKVTSYVV